MSEYRCEICGSELEVKPDVMRPGGFVVKPCETCTSCDDCDDRCVGCCDDKED